MRAALQVSVMAFALGIARAAVAAGTVPLPAPPPAGTPLAATLRDAMLAIERAEATNPAAAQNAAFSYDAAIEQYNAHEYERARASALAALSAAAAPPAPGAPPKPRPFQVPLPGPRYYMIPAEAPATAANAQTYVAQARRAMTNCANPTAAADDYRHAQSALSAKQYRVAMAASRNVADDCARR